MTLDVRFQFISHWAFNNHESFQAVFWQKILAGITANFCSNNSDGRIWAFYSTYLTLDRDNPGIGLIHFVRKLLFLLNGRYFSWVSYTSYSKLISIFSNIYIKDSWVHPILQRAHSNFRRPIKNWNLHVFE